VSEDQDHDQISDALEYDLAYKFFPRIKLQRLIRDLGQSYVARGLPIPYRVRFLNQGICDENHECLEIRYGTAYLRDCGIGSFEDHCDGIDSHLGDSESYAVVVMRVTSWGTAAEDATRWVLIRDAAAAHDDLRGGAYGMCPVDYCHQFDQDTRCLYDPSCVLNLATGACLPNVYCMTNSTQTGPRTLYASEGKHALYHFIEECDNGGTLGSDECSHNTYDMRDYIDLKLQNIGGLDSADLIDSTILDPQTCGQYDILANTEFGTAASYYSKFSPEIPWPLLAARACTPVQAAGTSYFTGAGCTADEYYASGNSADRGLTASWDGTGCASDWPLTVTVVSYRDVLGYCHDAWPDGTVRADLVPVTRAGLPGPSNCSPCPEDVCMPASTRDRSYHRSYDCTGYEFFDPEGFGDLRASWNGTGCLGTLVAQRPINSYRDAAGYCHALGSTTYPEGTVRIYRDTSPPPNCAACGESSCSPVNITGSSFFAGIECTGTEYASPGANTNRQSWEGNGCSGNLIQSASLTSMRDPQGYCWPTSSAEKVRIYRTSEPTLSSCPGCAERSCRSVSGTGWSYFTDTNCRGDEYFQIQQGSSTRRSWDGTGCAGDLARFGISIRSYKDSTGHCTNSNGFAGSLSRIYRAGTAPPPTGCPKCSDIQDGGGH
jgi:hypothetical protein